MENRDQLKALLQKYVSGQCSAGEAREVLTWLQSAEGARELEKLMDEASADVFTDIPETDPGISSEIYGRLRASMRLKDSLSEDSLPNDSLQSRAAGAIRFGRSRIAAVLIGFILLSVAGFFAVRAYNTVTYATRYAQQEVIMLPDGSKVTLNGNSRLSYPRNWKDQKIRRVHLEGEGFFEVAKDKQKPFVVTTSEISIRVLGTVFNVSSYKEDKTIETTLVEGKVVIRKLGKRLGEGEITLKPNQKATYEKRSASIALDEVKTELYTSWKDGLLIFEDEPFGEIARELERWYGVSIDIRDEASRKCRFTIKIKNESLDEVMKLFASATAASYTNDNGKVVVKGKLCK